MPFVGATSGFTLTELLIVIVILGVLTGIVVFAVGAFTDRGEVGRLQGRQEDGRGCGRGLPRATTGAYSPTVRPALTIDAIAPEYMRQPCPRAPQYTIEITCPNAGTVVRHRSLVGNGTC